MDVEVVGGSPIGRVEPVSVYDRRYDRHFEHFAYIPDPLPDRLHLAPPTWTAAAKAESAMTRLDGAASELPHPLLVVRPIIRREAVSTSALEGTYSPIDELLGAEATKEIERPETREVLNYVDAVETGIDLLERRPVSVNMINQLHAVLLKDVRGDSYRTGVVREHQNWVGAEDCTISKSRFVPPPAEYLSDGLSAWEKWIHRDDLPVVVRAALGHYQFETLHPYSDGNGRLGRLVVTLQFIEEKVLRGHLVSISPYLEGRRDEYLGQLRRLTATGDFDRWVTFFSTVMETAADNSLTRIRQLEEVRDEAVGRLREDNIKGTAVRIAEDLVGYPALTISDAASRYGVSYQATRAAVDKLVDRGILRSDERAYNRLFFSQKAIGILR